MYVSCSRENVPPPPRTPPHTPNIIYGRETSLTYIVFSISEKVFSLDIFCLNIIILFEPPHDKTNKVACAPIEDSDQPGNPPSQSDQSLRCPHEESLGH